MTMVATGLAVAHFLGEDSISDLPLVAGIGLIVVGALLALGSYATYRRNDIAITAGETIKRSVLPLVLLVTIGAASVVAVALSLSA